MSHETTVYSYSVFAEDGRYGRSIEADELLKVIQAELQSASNEEQELRENQEQQPTRYAGPPPSYLKVADQLDKVRWGIIWPPKKDLSVAELAHQKALARLIAHRSKQMGGKKPHEFYYQPGWTSSDFLWEEGRGVERGTMKPDIVPYYLCIVGSPTRIPWEFQQHLDLEYAVGRLWFDDPADCARYVDCLLAYEDPQTVPATAREALFVGAQYPGDNPTTLSATRLVTPLHTWLQGNGDLKFQASLLVGEEAGREATKKHLLLRLKGRSLNDTTQPPPVLLFTAGHGLEHDSPSPAQYDDQGALLFQEWPGPFNPVQPSDYLAGNDVSADMQLAGMMAFCFACFSAGTPLEKDWQQASWLSKPAKIASQPFVAALPQKLLAHGLLAFIGHVSRAWTFSFMGVKGTNEQSDTLRETLGQILNGQPVGHATDYLNMRWLQLTASVDEGLGANKKGKTKDEILDLWIARNDCRGWVVIGDPAARLNVHALQRLSQ